jgi:ubiquinone biosynthesis protein COQ9
LVPATQRDPGLTAFFVATLSQSAARIAEAAGVATRGWLGPLRVEALGLLILHVSRTWLDDADPDLATTMKTLDTALERAERWSRFGQAA